MDHRGAKKVGNDGEHGRDEEPGRPSKQVGRNGELPVEHVPQQQRRQEVAARERKVLHVQQRMADEPDVAQEERQGEQRSPPGLAARPERPPGAPPAWRGAG